MPDKFKKKVQKSVAAMNFMFSVAVLKVVCAFDN